MIRLRWPRWLFPRRTAPAPAPQPAPKPQPASTTTPSPSPTTRDTFDPSAPLRVNFNQLQGFSAAEREKLQAAARLVESVVNSPEFKEAVLSRAFVQTGGRTNEEIYAAIRAAKENFTQAADGEMDLELVLKNFRFWQRNVVGYTYESVPDITLNRRFFQSYTPAEIAGNLVHEWLHKLGFEHDFDRTARRPHSVPYAVGEIVEALAARNAA